MEEHSIYKLIDPRDELPFYVGITNDPEVRFTQHRSYGMNVEKWQRIQSIYDDGMEPRMEIIEKWDDRKLARKRERYWVLTYIDWGIPITNIRYTEGFIKRTDNVSQLTPRVSKANFEAFLVWEREHEFILSAVNAWFP